MLKANCRWCYYEKSQCKPCSCLKSRRHAERSVNLRRVEFTCKLFVGDFVYRSLVVTALLLNSVLPARFLQVDLSYIAQNTHLLPYDFVCTHILHTIQATQDSNFRTAQVFRRIAVSPVIICPKEVQV